MFKLRADKLQALEDLDLSPIRERACAKAGWDEEKALMVEAEYRLFLSLAIHFPGDRISPTPDVDEFWHVHLLDTGAYEADCKRVFGRTLHHKPRSAEAASSRTRASERVQELQEAGRSIGATGNDRSRYGPCCFILS